MTVLIPCLECGTPGPTGRCDRHRRPEPSKPSPSRRGYDRAWQRLSRLARDLHPWCSDCGATEDLTADHLRWPAYTLGDVQVVCRRCAGARPVRRAFTEAGRRRLDSQGPGHPPAPGSGLAYPPRRSNFPLTPEEGAE